MVLISLGTISLITYTLVRVQTGINIYWGEVLAGAYLYKKLGVFNVLVIVFGGLFWLLMISGLFFSVFDDGSTTNNSSNLYSYEREITVGGCLLISGWHVGCESEYAYYKVMSVIELEEEAGIPSYEEKDQYKSNSDGHKFISTISLEEMETDG